MTKVVNIPEKALKVLSSRWTTAAMELIDSILTSLEAGQYDDDMMSNYTELGKYLLSMTLMKTLSELETPDLTGDDPQ